MSRHRHALVLLTGALLAFPSVGRAVTLRTVCDSGCQYTSITLAGNFSSKGDEIEVMPGTYDEQVVINNQVSIFGAPGEPRPVIEYSGTGATFTIVPAAAGTTMRDLDIRGTGMSTSALEADGSVTATDLDLAATGSCAFLVAPTPSRLGPGVTATMTGAGTPFSCVTAGGNAADVVTGITVRAPDAEGVVIASLGTLTDTTVNAHTALILQGGGTARRSTLNGTAVGVEAASGLAPKAPLLSDSVVTSTADNGIAVRAPSVNTFPATVRLRNVTAIASGHNSTGIEAQAQITANSTADWIDARNVIARGTARDVFGEPAADSGCPGPCAPGQVIIGYSNFLTSAGLVDTTIGHNQSGDPLLVNPETGAGQDFHIATANSPLIGAGTPDPNDGPTDRDGIQHRNPPAIGAYEYTGPAGPPPAGPGAGGGTPPSQGGGSTRPTLSQLAETNRVFAVARTSTQPRGRTANARHRRGTIFLFRLDQPATITVTITTRAGCRRPTTGTRQTRECTRAVANLTRTAHAGLNKLPFSGRIRGKPLPPGGYRAAFVATNSRGSSAQKALSFTVARR